MIQIKNANEMEKMRRACAISAAALRYGGQHIEAGFKINARLFNDRDIFNVKL